MVREDDARRLGGRSGTETDDDARAPDAGRHPSDRQEWPSWDWAGLKKLGR